VRNCSLRWSTYYPHRRTLYCI